MAKWMIYGLCRPSRRIFYIGATNNLKRRGKEHRRWLKGKIETIVFEVGEGDGRATAEHRWIQAFRDFGGPIVNKTEGGDGAETLSSEVKSKISARHKGKVVSEETKRLISKAQKGRPRNWSSEGAARVRDSQLRLGHNLYATLPPQTQDRIKQASAEQWTEISIEERSRRATERNRQTWNNYTPEQRAERGRRIREGQLSKLSPERRSEMARQAALAATADPAAFSERKRQELQARWKNLSPEALAAEHARLSRQTTNWWISLTEEQRADYFEKRRVGVRRAKAMRDLFDDNAV